jgi:hypothetical protein
MCGHTMIRQEPASTDKEVTDAIRKDAEDV